MDYVPMAVGAGVGLGDGVLGQIANSPNAGFLERWKHTLYRAGVVALGAAGDALWGWSPDVSYGLMTSGMTLLASRIPAAIGGGGTNAFGYVYLGEVGGKDLPGKLYPGSVHQLQPAAGYRAAPMAAGCSGCAQAAAQRAAATQGHDWQGYLPSRSPAIAAGNLDYGPAPGWPRGADGPPGGLGRNQRPTSVA